jgi:hypothetical protein
MPVSFANAKIMLNPKAVLTKPAAASWACSLAAQAS